jgi:L-ascorbate metabolism protein UlaG (beta-lactamase superfamily)
MEIKHVRIDYLGHSGFMISNGNNKKIVIDPYNVSDKVEKADLILITHTHYDHCSIKDIMKLAKKGTTIVIPADAQSKITKIKDIEMQIIEPGEEFTFGAVKVQAVPAYNVEKDFHPKSEGWMGYVIKISDVIIYHAGDTDKIPEMSKLNGYGKKENNFVALLPISGGFVMGVDDAIDAASLINPDVVIPMHYGAGVEGTVEDAKRFVDGCKKLGLRAEILEKI